MHYDEFYQDRLFGFDKEDLSAIHASEDGDRRQREENVLKQKEGKPEGARYCFLESLSDAPYGLGYLFGRLVEERASEKEKFLETIGLSIKSIRREYSVIKKPIINDLIKLRYDAIKSGKYKVNGYKQKINIDLLLDALARHYIKFSFGDYRDEESGCLHLSHMLANLFIIKYQVQTHGLGE